VVISGHLHEVLTILGYLNASSIAEELELGKQKMRNSARLSLDESLTVYPVQFSPNNWFKALSPNLNPEDLTMAKESIRDIYLDKQKELLRAKGDLQKAELMSTSPEDVANAQKEVDDAKKAVSSAESALIKQFGEGIVGVAKIYFNMHGGGSINKAKALDLGALDPSQKYMDSLQQAVDGISKTQEIQDKLTTAIGNLSATMAKKSEVESKEWTLNKETMRQRVNELEMDIKYYGDLLVGVTKVAAKQTRIETIRKSYTNNNLVYQFGVSDVITGGSFTIKLGDTVTNPVEITPPVSPAKIDFSDIESKINTVIAAKWAGSTAVALDKDKSPGYYTVTFSNQSKELDLFIDEQQLLPAVEVKEPNVLPKEVSAEDAEIQGMFTDILIKISDSNDSSTTNATSQASASKWGVSLWFASASGSSGQSSGSSQQRSEFFSQEIEIGFRVAKVSFERGGWFNPQIFKMSHAFTRLADMLLAPGITVDDIKGKEQKDLSKMLTYEDKDQKILNYILPAFPVAMVVVKDVTIKVKKSKMTSEAAKSVVENASASSGGFLCFSVSSSSSSKNSSESSMHGSHGEYYYIRIPGPQILGYFLQMLPKDNAEMYKPTTSSDGKNEILEAFKLYDSAPAELLKASSEIMNITNPVDRANN